MAKQAETQTEWSHPILGNNRQQKNIPSEITQAHTENTGEITPSTITQANQEEFIKKIMEKQEMNMKNLEKQIEKREKEKDKKGMRR